MKENFGRNISESQVSQITSSLDRVSQASELTPPSSQTNLGIRLDRFYLFSIVHTLTINPLLALMRKLDSEWLVPGSICSG